MKKLHIELSNHEEEEDFKWIFTDTELMEKINGILVLEPEEVTTTKEKFIEKTARMVEQEIKYLRGKPEDKIDLAVWDGNDVVGEYYVNGDLQ